MGRSCSGCRLQRPITLQPRVSRVCRCHAGRIPKDLSTFRESRARTPLRACRVIDKRGGEQSSLLKTGRDVQLGKTVGTRENTPPSRRRGIRVSVTVVLNNDTLRNVCIPAFARAPRWSLTQHRPRLTTPAAPLAQRPLLFQAHLSKLAF